MSPCVGREGVLHREQEVLDREMGGQQLGLRSEAGAQATELRGRRGGFAHERAHVGRSEHVGLLQVDQLSLAGDAPLHMPAELATL